MVNKATEKKWSNFIDMKSGMVEWTCEFLHKMKSWGISVSVIQLNPARENLKLEKQASIVDCTPLQLLEFEFTS